ncbi:MAG: PD-(D/E)XK nuclease family protein [Treponema sp.]|nr:PD-(D/E)XK nuclease family protein [Treponema sp.]
MNLVENTLLENIDNPDSLFIFPTDIAASRWADHLLRLKNGGSIAMDKFTAWDDFKGNSIKSKVKNKTSIPSALRKIFIERLINDNSEAVKQGNQPIFTSIIRVEWALQAAQFASWLSGVLPQLGTWFNKMTGFSIDEILSEKIENICCNFEGDDKDMYILSRSYAKFLETYNLFEHAWETPPFNNDGKECFLFFPESLSDYSDYKDLLSKSEHVNIININDIEKNETQKNSETFFYTNSRSEIKEAALFIRSLNEKHGISWDSIVVCLSDAENYEPYVIREFKNRNIPFVKRTSKLLSDYPAGNFFRSLLDCATSDFSFSSVAALILNKNLPWKNTDLDTIDELINFGIKNNCLYSWYEKTQTDEKKQLINVWEDAFDNPIEYFDKELRSFYNNLKKHILSFRSSITFHELQKQYFMFREHFFDMELCSEETDLILSRCICELMELVELEKNFPDIKVIDPFLFFTEQLGEKPYLAQTKSSGVSILPYKAAAAAPFDCHIILGAGQENLSVINSRLEFLSKKKREKLGLADEDASASFINMHKYNSVKTSAFFCCEKSFSGFAIPHSKINAPVEPKDRYTEENDFYLMENLYFNSLLSSSSLNGKEINRLHENQKNGFLNWQKRRLNTGKTPNYKWNTTKEIQNIINTSYAKTGKYSVSATSLQKYFQCSLKWLFERVFTLENTQIETTLMAKNISGLIYHAVLNNFFIELKKLDKPLMEPVTEGLQPSLPKPYLVLLTESLDSVFNSFPSLQMSSLTSRIIKAAKNDFKYNLEKCLISFITYFTGYSIMGSECYYDKKNDKDMYILNGYIDCLLKDNSKENDNCTIVDFKLKWTPHRSDCIAEEDDPLCDFQLPMYITLAEDNEKKVFSTALFFSIIECKAEVIIGTIRNTITDKIIPGKEKDQIIHGSEWYKKIFKEFNNKAEQFVQEISTGNFTVFPQNNNDCFDCEYQRICRTVYIVNRESNLCN